MPNDTLSLPVVDGLSVLPPSAVFWIPPMLPVQNEHGGPSHTFWFASW